MPGRLIMEHMDQRRWEVIRQEQARTGQWTWLGMFGNGAMTGMASIITVQIPGVIQRVRQAEQAKLSAAGHGASTAIHITCDARSAIIMSLRLNAITTHSVSVALSDLSP